MEELDLSPMENELSKAIYSLAHGKAPGKGSIPAEVIQCGKLALLQYPIKLLYLCWDKGLVPQDMHDGIFITLYKIKGYHSDCDKYRGISLLSIIEKIFAQMALNSCRY